MLQLFTGMAKDESDITLISEDASYQKSKQ